MWGKWFFSNRIRKRQWFFTGSLAFCVITAVFQTAVEGLIVRKPTIEIINIGLDMWEIHVYVSTNLVIVTTCNTNALIKSIGEYIATEV